MITSGTSRGTATAALIGSSISRRNSGRVHDVVGGVAQALQQGDVARAVESVERDLAILTAEPDEFRLREVKAVHAHQPGAAAELVRDRSASVDFPPPGGPVIPSSLGRPRRRGGALARRLADPDRDGLACGVVGHTATVLFGAWQLVRAGAVTPPGPDGSSSWCERTQRIRGSRSPARAASHAPRSTTVWTCCSTPACSPTTGRDRARAAGGHVVRFNEASGVVYRRRLRRERSRLRHLRPRRQTWSSSGARSTSRRGLR